MDADASRVRLQELLETLRSLARGDAELHAEGEAYARACEDLEVLSTQLSEGDAELMELFFAMKLPAAVEATFEHIIAVYGDCVDPDSTLAYECAMVITAIIQCRKDAGRVLRCIPTLFAVVLDERVVTDVRQAAADALVKLSSAPDRTDGKAVEILKLWSGLNLAAVEKHLAAAGSFALQEALVWLLCCWPKCKRLVQELEHKYAPLRAASSRENNALADARGLLSSFNEHTTTSCVLSVMPYRVDGFDQRLQNVWVDWNQVDLVCRDLASQGALGQFDAKLNTTEIAAIVIERADPSSQALATSQNAHYWLHVDLSPLYAATLPENQVELQQGANPDGGGARVSLLIEHGDLTMWRERVAPRLAASGLPVHEKERMMSCTPMLNVRGAAPPQPPQPSHLSLLSDPAFNLDASDAASSQRKASATGPIRLPRQNQASDEAFARPAMAQLPAGAAAAPRAYEQRKVSVTAAIRSCSVSNGATTPHALRHAPILHDEEGPTNDYCGSQGSSSWEHVSEPQGHSQMEFPPPIPVDDVVDQSASAAGMAADDAPPDSADDAARQPSDDGAAASADDADDPPPPIAPAAIPAPAAEHSHDGDESDGDSAPLRKARPQERAKPAAPPKATQLPAAEKKNARAQRGERARDASEAPVAEDDALPDSADDTARQSSDDGAAASADDADDLPPPIAPAATPAPAAEPSHDGDESDSDSAPLRKARPQERAKPAAPPKATQLPAADKKSARAQRGERARDASEAPVAEAPPETGREAHQDEDPHWASARAETEPNPLVSARSDHQPAAPKPAAALAKGQKDPPRRKSVSFAEAPARAPADAAALGASRVTRTSNRDQSDKRSAGSDSRQNGQASAAVAASKRNQGRESPPPPPRESTASISPADEQPVPEPTPPAAPVAPAANKAAPKAAPPAEEPAPKAPSPAASDAPANENSAPKPTPPAAFAPAAEKAAPLAKKAALKPTLPAASDAPADAPADETPAPPAASVAPASKKAAPKAAPLAKKAALKPTLPAASDAPADAQADETPAPPAASVAPAAKKAAPKAPPPAASDAPASKKAAPKAVPPAEKPAPEAPPPAASDAPADEMPAPKPTPPAASVAPAAKKAAKKAAPKAPPPAASDEPADETPAPKPTPAAASVAPAAKKAAPKAAPPAKKAASTTSPTASDTPADETPAPKPTPAAASVAPAAKKAAKKAAPKAPSAASNAPADETSAPKPTPAAASVAPATKKTTPKARPPAASVEPASKKAAPKTAPPAKKVAPKTMPTAASVSPASKKAAPKVAPPAASSAPAAEKAALKAAPPASFVLPAAKKAAKKAAPKAAPPGASVSPTSEKVALKAAPPASSVSPVSKKAAPLPSGTSGEPAAKKALLKAAPPAASGVPAAKKAASKTALPDVSSAPAAKKVSPPKLKRSGVAVAATGKSQAKPGAGDTRGLAEADVFEFGGAAAPADAFEFDDDSQPARNRRRLARGVAEARASSQAEDATPVADGGNSAEGSPGQTKRPLPAEEEKAPHSPGVFEAELAVPPVEDPSPVASEVDALEAVDEAVDAALDAFMDAAVDEAAAEVVDADIAAPEKAPVTEPAVTADGAIEPAAQQAEAGDEPGEQDATGAALAAAAAAAEAEDATAQPPAAFDPKPAGRLRLRKQAPLARVSPRLGSGKQAPAEAQAPAEQQAPEAQAPAEQQAPSAPAPKAAAAPAALKRGARKPPPLAQLRADLLAVDEFHLSIDLLSSQASGAKRAEHGGLAAGLASAAGLVPAEDVAEEEEEPPNATACDDDANAWPQEAPPLAQPRGDETAWPISARLLSSPSSASPVSDRAGLDVSAFEEEALPLPKRLRFGSVGGGAAPDAGRKSATAARGGPKPAPLEITGGGAKEHVQEAVKKPVKEKEPAKEPVKPPSIARVAPMAKMGSPMAKVGSKRTSRETVGATSAVSKAAPPVVRQAPRPLPPPRPAAALPFAAPLAAPARKRSAGGAHPGDAVDVKKLRIDLQRTVGACQEFSLAGARDVLADASLQLAALHTEARATLAKTTNTFTDSSSGGAAAQRCKARYDALKARAAELNRLAGERAEARKALAASASARAARLAATLTQAQRQGERAYEAVRRTVDQARATKNARVAKMAVRAKKGGESNLMALVQAALG